MGIIFSLDKVIFCQGIYFSYTEVDPATVKHKHCYLDVCQRWGLVDLAAGSCGYLQRTQGAVIVLNDFGWKVLEHILLHPPQKEWKHLPVQGLHCQHTWKVIRECFIGKPRQTHLCNSKGSAHCLQTCLLLSWRTFGITTGQDGFPVTGSELALCSQEARHEEVKQRPELQDVVLRVIWRIWRKIKKNRRGENAAWKQVGLLTWMGVPDKMTRKLAASCLMAFDSLVFPFLMTWPSSRMQ